MKKRILIIDDDELFVDTVRFVLEQEEHDVTDASNGVVGVELAISLRPDLILCDVRMRNMHGYVAVQELRNHPRTSNVPIIMMTGQASAYGERRSQMAGADFYLSKPFAVSELKEAVDTALNKRKRRVRSTDVIFPSSGHGKG